MKRLRLASILLLALSLTGCMQKYEFTEQQSSSAAEYMAGLLLKSDKNYEMNLVSVADMISVDTTNGQNTPTLILPMDNDNNSETDEKALDSGETSGSGSKEYTLTEVIDDKNFNIQYLSYQITDEYPKDKKSSYFSLTPNEGDQLFVVSFSVKNISDKDATLNLSKSKIQYQLDVNEDIVYKPSLTLLENDMQYINMDVKKGKEETMLLIFEISKKADISKINLNVSNNEKTEIIEIK
jgi:hypothetical protein